jgi:hypothetical protein
VVLPPHSYFDTYSLNLDNGVRIAIGLDILLIQRLQALLGTFSSLPGQFDLLSVSSLGLMSLYFIYCTSKVSMRLFI